MLRYPISTLLYLAKLSIKDKIQDALKLHNNIDVKLTVTVKDKDGKIIKVHKQKSHSFVMNFLSILAMAMLNPFGNSSNYYYVLATNDAWYNVTPVAQITQILAILDSANDSTYGIVVGTGTATPTPMDYALGNQIQNGTGNGQLQYSAHTISPAPAPASVNDQTTTPSSGVLPVSGKTTSFQVSRQFTNQSGASITVSEVGIIAKISDWYQSGNQSVYVLIIHDLLSPAVTVPNLSILQITYTISVTT
jgi:hypothetical protein